MARRKQDESEQLEEFEAVISSEEHEQEQLEAPAPEPRKKAVRRSKAKTEAKPISRYTAVKATSAALSSVHTLGAKVLQEPALELSQDEAKRFAEAGLDLLEAYGITLSSHPKVAAWIAFLTVCGEVEAPRFILLIKRPPRERRSQAPQGPPPPIILPMQEREEAL